MCEKVNSKNPRTLQFISNHYKTQKMCEKTTDYYPHPLYVPDRYITQEMSKKIVSKKLFILKYFLDKYKTQEMCGKALEAYPSLLKVVFDWFITNKMLKYLDNSVFFNGNIVFFLNADSDNVHFSVTMWALLMLNIILLALDIIMLTMMILKLLFKLTL